MLLVASSSCCYLGCAFFCWRFCCCWLFCSFWRFPVAGVSAFVCVSTVVCDIVFRLTNVANFPPVSGSPMILLSVMSLLLLMFLLQLASAVADLPAVAVVGTPADVADRDVAALALLLPIFSFRDCWFSSTVGSTAWSTRYRQKLYTVVYL
jgi:hypothetical protein